MSNEELAGQRIELSTHLTSFAANDPGDWTPMFDRARLLEQAGFDRLVVSDHVVFGENIDEYAKPSVGGQPGGRQPTGPDGHWLEPLTTLAVLAGMTSTIRLGTSILLAALRRPAVLAKTAATLDVLSSGRFDLGVGVGWQREEYLAAGLDFDNRGRLLDHTLEVCQTLWTQMRAEYDSPELMFAGIHAMPKPTRPSGVPIWISGTVNQRVVSRLVRFGVGWIPWGDAAADIKPALKQMQTRLGDAGGNPDTLQVTGNLASVRAADGSLDIDRTLEQVPELVAAGITDFRVHVSTPADTDALGYLRHFVDTFHAVTGRTHETCRKVAPTRNPPTTTTT